jgi:hypothetical protein
MKWIVVGYKKRNIRETADSGVVIPTRIRNFADVSLCRAANTLFYQQLSRESIDSGPSVFYGTQALEDLKQFRQITD